MHHTIIQKDYIWNTIGVLLQNAISPLLLVVVTRINGIYDSGMFSFAFSVAIIFWVISMWGGRTYQVSDINREFSHRSYIMVRLVLTLFALAGALAFSVINHYDQVKEELIMTLVLFKAMESIADAIHGVLQANDRLYVVGKSLAYKAVAGFAAFLIIDVLTQDILLGCVGLVVVNILIIFLYDFPRAKRLESLDFPVHEVAKIVKSSIQIIRRTSPVFAVLFLSMFSLNIPRYFIDLYHQEQIGYFGIIAMPITLIGLSMVFILQPKVVYLTRAYDSGEYKKFQKAISNLLLITTCIGLVILVVSYVFGVPLLKLIFGIDFLQYRSALMIVIIGGVINAVVSVFINIFTIIRRFKQQFYVLVATNLLLAICSAVLIRTGGLLSGVVLFSAANLLQMVLLWGVYKITMDKALKVHN